MQKNTIKEQKQFWNNVLDVFYVKKNGKTVFKLKHQTCSRFSSLHLKQILFFLRKLLQWMLGMEKANPILSNNNV